MKVLLVVLIVAAVTQAANINLDYLKTSHSNLPSSVLRFGDARIVGGEEAKPHQFPYQAAIFIEKKNDVYFCGGSLISNISVLTAAQCVDGATEIHVILGTHDLNDKQAQIFDGITKFIIHPKWDSEKLTNDIAIVKLPQAVELNENITLVNLPSDTTQLYVGDNATVSGWGIVSDTSSLPFVDILRFTSNTVISNKECSDTYGSEITNSYLCVSGKKGKSPCLNDAGDPLTVTYNNVTTQIGVMSLLHKDGCRREHPAIYTRITSYLDWIKENSSNTIKMSKYLFIIQFVLFFYSKIR